MTETRTSAKKLAEAVALSNERLRPMRRNRRMFLRQYAGPYFSAPSATSFSRDPQGSALGQGSVLSAGHASGPAEPLNTIYSVVSVILPHLVATNPRAMIRTPFPELRRAADLFALAWNHQAAEIDLGRSLRTVVTDALFGAGIMKTGLAPARAALLGCHGPASSQDRAPQADGSHGPAAAGSSTAGKMPAGRKGETPSPRQTPSPLPDPGEPFADPVDLDDYVIDPFARRREEAAFEGNRYRLSRRQILESGLFDAAAVEALSSAAATDDPIRRPDGRTTSDAELVDTVELIDLWLPHEGVVVTIAAGDAADASGKFLREVPWEGPARGPYEMLGFHWASGSPLPVPPVGLFYDLHVMINKLARKQARQADRQKDLVLFDDRASEEAQKLRDAFDGEMVGMQSVDRYRQVSFGGPHAETYDQLGFLFEQFSRIAGNVDLLGGLSPMSKTLGQDEMLFESTTVRIEDMRAQVYEFTKHVGMKLAWYLWHDPLVDLPLAISDFGLRNADLGKEQNAVVGNPQSEIRNPQFRAAARFSADTRQGEWLDYHFDVEPHSMSQDTPTRKYRRVLEWIQNVILPIAPLAAEQGLRLDVARLAKLTGAMLNIEEAAGIFTRDGAGGVGHPGSK